MIDQVPLRHLLQRERCMRPSVASYNFIRTFYCSLPVGHEGEHIAYWSHDPDYGGGWGEQQPAWEGPWAEDDGDRA